MPEAFTPATLAAQVDRIIDTGHFDPETGHSREDMLATALILQFTPEWVREEWLRLGQADFPRWCA